MKRVNKYDIYQEASTSTLLEDSTKVSTICLPIGPFITFPEKKNTENVFLIVEHAVIHPARPKQQSAVKDGL